MTKYTNGANGTAERLSGASDAKYDDGTRYHIIRDGVMRMAVRGSELKATDIVESVDDPDSRTQLVADIQAWLESNVGFSVWLTDLMEQVHGWLDRQAAIIERECANTRVNFAERVEFVSRIDELKANRRRQAETIRRLSNENDELKSKLDYLEGHGVEIVDAVAGGYEVYNEWYRKAQELEEAMAMDSRIRAQQSNCIDNLAKRRDELESQVEKLERVNRYGWECECKLQSERDALADDLAECMEERDYWKQEVQHCMDAAYPPSHAPERPYDPRVMAYPDREGCTTPSTLVSAMIDGLRDDVRDTVMPIIEESANAKADCERWREACGSMMDVAHEIERIMAEMELR